MSEKNRSAWRWWHYLLTGLLVTAVLIGAWLAVGQQSTGSGERVTPWSVVRHADDSTEVLGVHLGSSSLRDMLDVWHNEPQLAVFRDPDGSLALEAFYSSIVFSGVSGRLILQLEAEDAWLEAASKRAIKREPMPSGAYQLSLTDDDMGQAVARRIVALSFVPGFSGLEVPVIEARFGKAEQRYPISEERELLVYPHIGLVVVHDPDGKELLHYVIPARLDALVEKLRAE